MNSLQIETLCPEVKVCTLQCPCEKKHTPHTALQHLVKTKCNAGCRILVWNSKLELQSVKTCFIWDLKALDRIWNAYGIHWVNARGFLLLCTSRGIFPVLVRFLNYLEHINTEFATSTEPPQSVFNNEVINEADGGNVRWKKFLMFSFAILRFPYLWNILGGFEHVHLCGLTNQEKHEFENIDFQFGDYPGSQSAGHSEKVSQNQTTFVNWKFLFLVLNIINLD